MGTRARSRCSVAYKPVSARAIMRYSGRATRDLARFAAGLVRISRLPKSHAPLDD